MTREDEEYEKDLNELKEQIFKEGNTLISKQDLLERFVEIDNEYKNSHWNLLQILANIDILIGKEPCEDAVSRQAVLDKSWELVYPDGTSERVVSVKDIEALLSVNPQKPKASYISIDDVMSVFDDFMCGEVDEDGTEIFLEMLKDKAESEVNNG